MVEGTPVPTPPPVVVLPPPPPPQQPPPIFNIEPPVFNFTLGIDESGEDIIINFDDPDDDLPGGGDPIVFGEEKLATSAADTFQGNTENTEYVYDQAAGTGTPIAVSNSSGIFYDASPGEPPGTNIDTITDLGGANDRITFESLDDVTIRMTQDSNASFIHFHVYDSAIATIGAISSSNLHNTINVSRDVEDLQASSTDLSDLGSGGVVLFGGLDLVASETAYIVAGSDSGADSIDLSGDANAIGSIIFGKGGNDTLLKGTVDDDLIFGGAGNDVLDGAAGDNVLTGGDNDDTLRVTVAGVANDTITLSGTVEATDVFTAVINDRTISFTATTTTQSDARDGLLAAINNDSVIGSLVTATASGSDAITLTAASSTSFFHVDSVSVTNGGADNTQAIAFSVKGGNALIGGTGSDTAEYTNIGAAVTFTIANIGTVDTLTGISASHGGVDKIRGVEIIKGSGAGDSFVFNAYTGGLALTTITAGNGTNTFTDNNGTTTQFVSTITGGSGTDTFTLAQTAPDFSGVTLSGVENVNLSASATVQTLTFDASTSMSGATIAGAGSDDLLTSTAGMNLGGVTLSGIAKVNIDTGTDTAATLTVDGSTNLSTATIVGQGTNDIIQLAAGGVTISFASNTLTNISSINGGTGADTITGSSGADTIIGGTGADTLNGGGGADIYSYTATTDGSTTPGSGDTIATANFVSGTDAFRFATAAFGDGGLSASIAITDVVFNTNETTTLSDLTTAANTDQEAYFVELTGSTFNATLFDAIDTALANGSAATGRGFIVVDNNTDTKILFDSDFATAGAGTLVEITTITGLTDGTGISDADMAIA